MTETPPSLSPLLCFSLLVTRALINQPFSWESLVKPNLTGDQSAHTVYDHSHPRWTTQPDALSPISRAIFPGRPGSGGTRIDLSTEQAYSDEPLCMHFVLSSYTQHDSGTTSSHLINKQLTIIGKSECITKWAPKKLKSTQLPALVMVVRDCRTKRNDKTLQSPMA